MIQFSEQFNLHASANTTHEMHDVKKNTNKYLKESK